MEQLQDQIVCLRNAVKKLTDIILVLTRKAYPDTTGWDYRDIQDEVERIYQELEK